MDISYAIERFKKLSGEHRKEEIVNMLYECLKSTCMTEEQKCWAYWNISDNLAMLRKADEELINHKKFEKQIKSMDALYLPWLVCDATQRLNLICGGYKKYWDELYLYSCEHTPKLNENALIRFNSHRTAVYTTPAVKYEIDKKMTLFALDNLKESANELSASDLSGYKLIYYTQAFLIGKIIGNNTAVILEHAQQCFDGLHPLLADYADNRCIGSDSPLGSWEQLNTASEQKWAYIGINNYIVGLINAGEYTSAVYSYKIIKQYKINYGDYFEKRMHEAEMHLQKNKMDRI